MSQPQGTSPILIQNINTNTNSPHLPNDPNKKENGKTAIWVGLIALIGVIGVPLIEFFLSDKDKGHGSECSDLKKQLKQEVDELRIIETLLKSQSSDLKLKADKSTHQDNITLLNTKIITKKCD